MRVVIDTNVYLAAVLKPGLSEDLVHRGLEGNFTVLTSEHILAELQRKLAEKFAYPSDYAQKHISHIRSRSFLAEPGSELPDAVRDPDDRHILACAAAGRADLILSLGRDLLDLKEWRGIAIMHPKSFSWIVPRVEEVVLEYR